MKDRIGDRVGDRIEDSVGDMMDDKMEDRMKDRSPVAVVLWVPLVHCLSRNILPSSLIV